MAKVRVYLCTYRRNQLLPRALNSLLQQTFRDWVCELDNGAPGDPFPSKLAAEIGDPRITVINHERNLGGTATFNSFFRPISETYFSVLEDDNWWEPEFLARMVEVMEAHPKVQLGWANERYWREEEDGSWTDTGRNIWDRPTGSKPELFDWPQPQHLFGALHSVGAMLARSGVHGCMVPPGTEFQATEPFRERMYPFPLLFVPDRLANFALTQAIARKDPAVWTATQALLAGSLLACTSPSDDELRQHWKRAWRPGRQKSTHALFYAAMFFPECRRLIRFAGWRDWMFFLAYSARHPLRAMRTLRLHGKKQEEKEFLLRHTRAREEERQRRATAAAEILDGGPEAQRGPTRKSAAHLHGAIE